MPNTEEETAKGRRSRNKKLSPETARRVVSNPRRSIEDACLKPLHHPGKLALLEPRSGFMNGSCCSGPANK